MKDKKISRRQTLKTRYNIEKKVKASHKKLKKIAKNSKLPKRRDPGIPNNWPYKAELLEKIKTEKMLKKQKKQLNSIQTADINDLEPDKDAAEAFKQLLQNAENAISKFQANENKNDSLNEDISSFNKTTSNYVKILRRIINESDVLIEVLDARDPNACRNQQIEREIVSSGKKLVLLINKVDLVPREVVLKWLEFLRKSFPTEAFRAATTKSNKPLMFCRNNFETMDLNELKSTTIAVGPPSILNLLKNYSRIDSKSKSLITVGVIGIPNVGKSSVINSLCRNLRATKTGGEPGITKTFQEISLDKTIKLLDCPGVIPMETTNNTITSLVLNKAVKITPEDAIDYVDKIIKNYPSEQLMQIYKVPFFSSCSEFLLHVAKARGKVAKGGVYDYAAAADIVIKEWISGKISHYTLPPENVTEDVSSVPRYVVRFSEPFII